MKQNNPYILIANTVMSVLLAVLGWNRNCAIIDQFLLVLAGMYFTLVLWHASEMRRREEKRRIEEEDENDKSD